MAVIDYDSEIERLKNEINEIQFKIDLLERKKLDSIRKRYEETHRYATDALGHTYRAATEKMMDFARSVERTIPIHGAESKILESKGGSIPCIDEYRNKYFSTREYDDFDMIHSYLVEWSPVARDVWAMNKKISDERRKREWENSLWYQDMKEREEQYRQQKERERRRAEECPVTRIYDSDGGYWECDGHSSVYVDEFGEI